MGESNFLDLVRKRRLSRIDKKQTMLFMMFCALLAVLGSLSLSSDMFWPHVSSHPITLTRHTPLQTPTLEPPQQRVPTPTTPPTKTPTHAPVLDYPLIFGNTHLPEIALTFDDGPNPYYTPQVLAVLQHYRVKATFFDVGYLVSAYPDLVRQEYNQGNVVGDHSWSHPELTLLSASAILSQLASTSHAIQTALGVRPAFFRPPYGALNNIVLAQAKSLGLTTVLWNDSGRDWALPGVSQITYDILRLASYGSIILLHDGGGYRAQTVAALPAIITTLEQRGFKFVTIQQLVDDLQAPRSQSAYSTSSGRATFSTIALTELVFAASKRELYVGYTT
jgi:peptidoglycan-N-acetylglucosamine deacetylase